MSVRRYLLHQTALQRVPRAERADVVERVLVDHGLDAVADRRLGELSKGWLQRTVVAQALVANPALVLLDEPWSGLDDAARAHLTAVLDRALVAGAAVVFTSHEAIAVTGLRRLHLVDGHLAPGPPLHPPSPPAEPTGEGRPDAGLTGPAAAGGADGGVTEQGARVVLLARRIGVDADPGVVDRPWCLSHRVTPGTRARDRRRARGCPLAGRPARLDHPPCDPGEPGDRRGAGAVAVSPGR
jgi:energy-coupling factor transporter ATP-binding protein EcfA2